MPSPRPEVARLAERYHLGLRQTTHRGPAGDRLGKGTGASLEFQDRRAYVPGDDLRHLDWNAFARTDQLMVRLYREEILPRVDLCVDGSRSMAVSEDKARLATDLAGLFLDAGQRSGFSVRLIFLGDGPELVDADRLQRSGLEFEGRLPLEDALRSGLTLLQGGSIRILISDFLSPGDSRALVRPLADRCCGLALVQVLSREDEEPEVGSALRLTDAESGEMRDLVLDRRTVDSYRARLRRLGEVLRAECRRASGRFVSLRADVPLERSCRDNLVEAGLLAPA